MECWCPLFGALQFDPATAVVIFRTLDGVCSSARRYLYVWRCGDANFQWRALQSWFLSPTKQRASGEG